MTQVARKVLQDQSVNTDKLDLLAVATANLQNDSVTEPKIADDAVNTDQIADSAVIGDHLSPSAKQAVLESKLFAYPVQGLGFVTTNTAISDLITDFVFSRATTKRTGAFAAGKGVITASPDNRITIREEDSNDPVQDTSNREVFGRLSDIDTTLSGTSSFTNGSTTVNGVGTLYTTELSPGDYIKLDSDGVVYKINSITSDAVLDLDIVFTGVTASGSSSKTELAISYFVDINGAETAFPMAGQTIDIIFPEVFDLFTAPFNSPIIAVGFAEILAAEHNHDDLYFRETELQTSSGTTGASLIGIDPTALDWTTSTTVQDVLDDLTAFFQRFQRNEVLTVTATNTLSALSNTPADGIIHLEVFGVGQRQTLDYNVVGTTVAWIPGTAGFNLEIGDEVTAYYQSTD